MQKKLKVLMFSAIFPPAIGGPATQCFNLCKMLVKKDVEPVVVTYHTSKHFSVSNEHGFKVYYFKSIYTNTSLDKIIRWVVFPFFVFYIFKKEKIDILHCHSVSVLSFISAFIAKMLGIPRIIKFAGDWVWETLSTGKVQAKDFDDIYQKSWTAKFMVWFEKFGLNLFNRIWVVSVFRKENIKKLLGTDEKVFLLNNCLILENGGAKISNQNDIVKIVSANRFIPHKRIPFMVQLFSELNIPNSHLTIIGGGDQKEIELVKNAILEYNLGNKVELTGILAAEQVHAKFKESSFYISTSIEEGFPNVYIEAMNFGLPIISTDDGGSKELVVDKVTGFTFIPEDHTSVIDAMRKLSLDTELRNTMSQNAFERSKLFNLEIHIHKFIDLYKNLLENK